MKNYEIKILVLVFAVLGTISLIENNILEGVLLIFIGILLLFIDSYANRITGILKKNSELN